MDHIGMRVLITALYLIGGIGGGIAAANSNGWAALGLGSLLVVGALLRVRMLNKGWV